ncbi:DUF6326 family protein [Chloroflexota bacterium]
MDKDSRNTRVLEEVKINVKIKLSGLWVAAMFSWVYGDLLRLYSGDFGMGADIGGELISPGMLWLASAITMIVPGAMVFLSLALKNKVNRWANIIIGIFYTGYNLVGLSTYPSAYDKFLIMVSIVFTALIVWYAWRWPRQEA